MRTTINIDEDVLLAVKERSQRERRSAGEVLSALARDGLHAHDPELELAGDHHGFRALPRRGPAVSNALIDRLIEEEPE